MVYNPQIMFHFTALPTVWVFLTLHTAFFLHIFFPLHKSFAPSPWNAISSPPVNPSSSGLAQRSNFPMSPSLGVPALPSDKLTQPCAFLL